MTHAEGKRGDERARRSGRIVAIAAVLLLAGLGLLGWRLMQRIEALQGQVVELSDEAKRSAEASRRALERADRAEAEARESAVGREQAEAEARDAVERRTLAETETATALEEAELARLEAGSAREEAERAREERARAEAETERIRQRAEAEMQRLEEALGQIAETRRTALGLVMNLGGDHLKFAFDEAVLRPEDRELLSRICGILLTSPDHTISVNGHTDDIGSEAYNQELSERRARAVHDYLVSCGLPEQILSVTGHGKSQPLVQGKSAEARAKNRRVELGIVTTKIIYGRPEGK